jgi:hypothetical protein
MTLQDREKDKFVLQNGLVCVDQTQELLGSDDPDMDVNDMEIQKFE